MIKHFPEIETFFKQDNFIEDNLDALKQQILIKYSDKKLQKQALTLIELYLVKFSLSTPQELKRYKDKPQKKTDEKVINDKQKKLKNESIYKIKDLSISMVCEKYDIPLSTINRYLLKNELDEIHSGCLNKEQFSFILPMLQSKIKAIKRKKKEEKKILGRRSKKTNNNKRNFSGVYDEIRNKGGLGKLIYIRNK